MQKTGKGLIATTVRQALACGLLAGVLASACEAPEETAQPVDKRTSALSIPESPAVGLALLGRYASGVYNLGAAEIVAHDPRTQRLFVVNAAAATLDVLDIVDPAAPTKISTLNMKHFGETANSVAVRAGVVAVSIDAHEKKTDPGTVVFFDSQTLEPLSSVTVGAIPDMVTFTPNGRYLLVANEGEPNHYNSGNVDPEGSVSVIDLSGDIRRLDQSKVRTAGFGAFNGKEVQLRAAGIRIFGPGATVAQDLEPEYIAVSDDSRTAWVTLQENNALAVVDVERAQVKQLIPLGLKDHNASGRGLDPSDQDDEEGTAGAININPWPVKGMYQPDAIAFYGYQGRPYLVMANEGDAREYTGYREDNLRVGAAAYVLDPTRFPNAAELKLNRNLGRLTVSRASGDVDGDGDFDEIHAFGARSFSIRTGSGHLVFDSGDDMEQLTKELHPDRFNVSNSNNNFDSRSTSKGPEPEGVALGRAFGRVYAFVGLERIGGIMVYDVTNPEDVRFVNYLNTRDFAVAPGAARTPPAVPNAGDLGPEGLVFIKAEDSPTGEPLLVVGYEVSGTTAIYRVVKN